MQAYILWKGGFRSLVNPPDSHKFALHNSVLQHTAIVVVHCNLPFQSSPKVVSIASFVSLTIVEFPLTKYTQMQLSFNLCPKEQTMLALAYKDLADIDAVPSLNDGDMACLSEIRDILLKHGKLDRFGVNLLHSHFPIKDDEVLVETCDDEARTLTMKVKPKNALASPDLKATAWRLSSGETMLGCYSACVAAGGGHKRKHVQL